MSLHKSKIKQKESVETPSREVFMVRETPDFFSFLKNPWHHNCQSLGSPEISLVGMPFFADIIQGLYHWSLGEKNIYGKTFVVLLKSLFSNRKP